MQTVAKGLMTAIVLGVGYVDANFTPLFWVLLALMAIDVLLNVSHEGQQLNKIGSAVASLGGVALVESHLGNPDILKVSIAVLVLAYLQVVAPQVIALVKKIKFSKSPKANVFLQEQIISNLQAEVQRLTTQATQTAASTQVTTNAAAKAATEVVQTTSSPTDFHV